MFLFNETCNSVLLSKDREALALLCLLISKGQQVKLDDAPHLGQILGMPEDTVTRCVGTLQFLNIISLTETGTIALVNSQQYSPTHIRPIAIQDERAHPAVHGPRYPWAATILTEYQKTIGKMSSTDGRALASINDAIFKGATEDQLRKAIRNYSKSEHGRNQERYRYGALTFFNGKWKEYLDVPETHNEREDDAVNLIIRRLRGEG